MAYRLKTTLWSSMILAGVSMLDPAAASAAEQHGKLDFGRLNAAAERADRCDAKAQAVYDKGEQEQILAALTEQRACLEGILLATAREFYPPEAFGAGGMEARLADLRHSNDAILDPIYTRPRTCAPNCAPLYRIWAAEAYVTTVRTLLDGMLDRLKDESPYYRQ
ncbi:hypothetical protein [Insolitispirillum peregrinum]|uniref:hypothetical protein n=1 Tax=Insolitispirillum peregrinum TaxID=80876 RepID=UPI003615616D